jgi:cytochrome c2
MKREPLAHHERYLFGCLALCSIGGVLLALTILIAAWTMREGWRSGSNALSLGNPERGRDLVIRYGCPSCHILPDAGPEGLVGPTLDDMGGRSYIAGRFPNEEIWMSLWLQGPQELKPGTMMPDLNVDERDARDMAAYLATLR